MVSLLCPSEQVEPGSPTVSSISVMGRIIGKVEVQRLNVESWGKDIFLYNLYYQS